MKPISSDILQTFDTTLLSRSAFSRCESVYPYIGNKLFQLTTGFIEPKPRFKMVGTETGGRRRKSSGKKGGNKNDKKTEQVVKKGQGKGKGRGSGAKHETPTSKKNQRRLSGSPKKKGTDNRRNSKGKGKPKPEKKVPLTAEQLDASMDDYWHKSKDKTIVSKKLDNDMDDYWAKKGEGKTEEEAKEDTADAKEEAKAE